MKDRTRTVRAPRRSPHPARWLAALALVVWSCVAPAALHAQVPPGAAWRTLETENFRVTFGPGLERLAAHAAERAEVAYARLAAELGFAPRGTIEVLLTDYVDQSNGLATPFPSNRIILYARPPVDGLTLAYFHDWIDLLVVHELTHIFHLDRAGPLGRGLRTVLGRVPAPWPFFPAIATPTWSVEGLATFVESDHTHAGRVHGSYHEMVVRTAALADAFDSIERITGSGPMWPGPMRAYIYGSLFAEHLNQVHGDDAQRRLIEATADAWVPPPLAFDRVARRALGPSFTEAYAEWQAGLEHRFAALADSLRAQGLTESERLTAQGYQAAHPRAARDGRVAFAAYDARSATATRVLEPTSGAVRALSRRNGIGPSSWLPDGSLVTAQLEYHGPYRIGSDLYRVTADGRERRLTTGARLGEPDVAGDGRRVVAVRYGEGTNQLVLHDLETGRTRPITEPRADVHWALPRWAPDGERIAVGRWERGDYDVAVIDTAGTLLHRITRDRALDMAPAWSPDGRFVLFSSDRDGIPNLYAADLASAESPEQTPLRQVTRVLTGAFYPDVSPDGRWIYFARYDVDGFHIERMRYDPAAWHEPAPAPSVAIPRVAAEKTSGATVPDTLHTRPYSPLPSLLPRYWLPVVTGSPERTRRFYGATTSGRDVVHRHAYDVTAALEPTERLVAGRLAYSWAGLGNPVLGLEASRDWRYIHLTNRPEGAPEARLLAREDALGLSATLERRRWRSAAALSLGGEWVVERMHLFNAPGYGPGHPGTEFASVFARASVANYQTHPYSISREDGVSLYASGRVRHDLDPRHTDDGVVDRGYREVITQALGYKAVPGFGFARHVLATRVSALWRDGPGAGTSAIGGESGASVGVLGESWGSDTFLPVRGFGSDARYGTRAWTASLEYRVPIALLDRGFGVRPLYLDRLHGAAFLDAGNAWCSAEQAARSMLCPDTRAAPLVSAGAEIALDAAVLHSFLLRVRLGVAAPLQSPGARPAPSMYFLLGPSF